MKKYDYLYCHTCDERFENICEHDTCLDETLEVYSELLLSDARGIYIPRDFMQTCDLDKWHIPTDMRDFCQNPDDETYWDQWNDICNVAFFHLDDLRYHLEQDGDLFAIAHKAIKEEV